MADDIEISRFVPHFNVGSLSYKLHLITKVGGGSKMKIRIPKEEASLLTMMKKGAFDGVVGNVLTTNGGSNVWTEIRNGEPVRYKKGPGGKFFNGKENERYEGKLHILETWKTDEEKIGFLQKYGWLIEDAAAKKYSAKYK